MLSAKISLVGPAAHDQLSYSALSSNSGMKCHTSHPLINLSELRVALSSKGCQQELAKSIAAHRHLLRMSCLYFEMGG